MMSYGWTLFTVHLVFMNIILLNFLIAVMSQTYDAVISADSVEQYDSKTIMFMETAMMVDFLESILGIDMTNPCKIFYLQSSVAIDAIEDQYSGFTKTITNGLKKHNRETQNKLTLLQAQSEKTRSLVQQSMDALSALNEDMKKA
jgi:hypothetical protein